MSSMENMVCFQSRDGGDPVVKMRTHVIFQDMATEDYYRMIGSISHMRFVPCRDAS